jgi:hypothetical protein
LDQFVACFEGLEDPRTGNAGLHDLHELLVIALCTVLMVARKPATWIEQMNAVKDFFLQIFSSASGKIVLGAIVLSGIITSVAMAILGYNFTFSSGLVQPAPALSAAMKAALIAGFVIAFVVIWFILYIQTNQEAEDLYSFVRKKLTGTDWVVQYEASNGPSRPIKLGRPFIVACDVHINPSNKKLELVFTIPESNVWENNFQTITSVAIRYHVGNDYEMFHYYDVERNIHTEMAKYVTDLKVDRVIAIEMFAIIKFKVVSGRTQVNRMSGEWFDLNGNATKVFALVDEVTTAAARGAPYTARALSDMNLTSENFSAKMGKITFRRGPPPEDE